MFEEGNTVKVVYAKNDSESEYVGLVGKVADLMPYHSPTGPRLAVDVEFSDGRWGVFSSRQLEKVE